MSHPASLAEVRDAELGELGPPQRVEEVGREDRPVSDSLELVAFGSPEQRPGLIIGKSGGLALVGPLGRSLDAGDGVVLDGVLVGEVLEERADGRELAADGRGRQRPGQTGFAFFSYRPRLGPRPRCLEHIAPGDDVGPRDLPELLRPLDPAERDERLDVALVCASRVLVLDVGEPDDGGRDVAELMELGRREDGAAAGFPNGDLPAVGGADLLVVHDPPRLSCHRRLYS